MIAAVDVSEAFDDWLEPVRLTRSGSGAYVDGRWVAVTSQTVDIEAVVQNATPDDMKVLDDGQRSSEGLKLHSTCDMVAVDESTGKTGDTFCYESDTWKIHNVARRRIGNYNKAIALRVT